MAFDHRVRKMPSVSGLLAAESDGLQRRVIQIEETLRRQRRRSVKQLVVRSPRRGKRHLLFEDDVKKSREAGFARPHRRRAESSDYTAEIRIAPRQQANPSEKGFVVEAVKRFVKSSHSYRLDGAISELDRLAQKMRSTSLRVNQHLIWIVDPLH